MGAAIALAMALSARWALRVPIFQAPDEGAHFDYVVQLVAAGRPLLARERPVAAISAADPFIPYSHPLTWYLSVRTEERAIRGRPERKVPDGYGTRAFFADVDRGAPRLAGSLRNPWYITRYPVGYYGLAAIWASAWSRVYPGVVALLYASRALSVLLLGLGLLAWWWALRLRGGSAWRTVGILAAVGLFPLTSFVTSYVQPDALAFAVAPLCIGLALRAAGDREPDVVHLSLAGLALALAYLTKPHLFISLAVPIAALLATRHARARERAWLAWGLALLGPTVLAVALQRWINVGAPRSWVTTLASLSRRDALLEAGSVPAYAAALARAAAREFLSPGGVSFRTFWGNFGWGETPLVIGSAAIQRAVDRGLQVAVVLLLGLLLWRWLRAMQGLLRVRRRGRGARALALLCDPMWVAPALFGASILAVYAWTNNGFTAQGRNWFPFLPAMFWAATEAAPRALRRRRAVRGLSLAVLAALLLYGAVAAYWSLRTVESRYYGAPRARAAVSEIPPSP